MRLSLFVFALVVLLALISNLPLYAGTPVAGGTLTVITAPERAEVWIDGGYAGLSPIRDKQLAPGTYTLRLVDPSRQKSLSETVTIVEGERLMVERSLEGSYGRLRVDTDPQGADVSIIADLGKTPLVNDYLTPGQYRLEIKHPDGKYLTGIEDVTFVDGQPLNISYTLEKPKIFTKKRIVLSAVGVGTALGWTWMVHEYHNGNTGVRRTLSVITAATLSAALQVTIFIW